MPRRLSTRWPFVRHAARSGQRSRGRGNGHFRTHAAESLNSRIGGRSGLALPGTPVGRVGERPARAGDVSLCISRVREDVVGALSWTARGWPSAWHAGRSGQRAGSFANAPSRTHAVEFCQSRFAAGSWVAPAGTPVGRESAASVRFRWTRGGRARRRALERERERCRDGPRDSTIEAR